MIWFAIRLVRPYWRWLVIVVVAMLIETAMSLASPWPLKIVLDSVLDAQPAPAWLVWLVGADAGPAGGAEGRRHRDRRDRPAPGRQCT